MDDNREINLKKYHSSYIVAQALKGSPQSETTCKSELNVKNLPNKFSESSRNFDDVDFLQNKIFKGYYKRYEHDEIPVKDSNDNNLLNKGSLTNSDLDKLEMKIFRNVSQQLQTDVMATSLESNIKFFKTTVQEIFDNFYTNMQDFDLYKKRFQEILNKSREDSVADMEDFIKDMIQHIMASETASNQSRKTTELSMQAFTEGDINVSEISDGLYTDSNLTTGITSVLKAYNNDNYQTDSTIDNNSNKRSSNAETYNIFLLKSTPCVQIKTNDRNLLSEINIKDSNTYNKTRSNVSADNMNRFAAERTVMENNIMQPQGDMSDVEIPVKESYAKKNIHLDEDFTRESMDNKQSFMTKICNFLCKKFRKNAFG